MPERNKKILVISPTYPFPQRCGFTYRVGDMCRYLAKYFDLHILVTGDSIKMANLPEMHIFGEIYCPEKLSIPGCFNKISTNIKLRLLKPYFDDPFYELPHIKDTINTLCNQHDFYCAIVHTPMLGYCLKSLPDKVIKILDAHDLWFQKYLNFLAVGSGKLLSQFRDKNRELALYRSSDLTLAISLSDLDYMRSNGINNSIHVPPSFLPFILHDKKTESVVLLYSSGQGPLNIDAIKFFINRIFPLVKEKIPYAKFKILNSSQELRAKYGNRRDIILCQYANDLKTEYLECDLVVVPLRYANGIKIKVLESFAFGKPTIVSPAAIQGIQAATFAQRQISIDPKIFAQEVISAIKDRKYRQMLIDSELLIIREHYSPESAYGELVNRLSSHDNFKK